MRQNVSKKGVQILLQDTLQAISGVVGTGAVAATGHHDPVWWIGLLLAITSSVLGYLRTMPKDKK
jgi:hypothetical protein